MRYSQYINKQQKTTGILWQGHFFSSALDDKYNYYAFAYVENNPVKAKMVEKATDYIYSSAKHHAGMTVNKMITNYNIGIKQSEYLVYLQNMFHQNNDTLKTNTRKGLPCGSDAFISRLGDMVGRDLSFKGIGRPKKKVASPYSPKKRVASPYSPKKRVASPYSPLILPLFSKWY